MGSPLGLVGNFSNISYSTATSNRKYRRSNDINDDGQTGDSGLVRDDQNGDVTALIVKSMFNGTKFYYRPDTGGPETGTDAMTSTHGDANDDGTVKFGHTLHGTDPSKTYDISTNSIIEYTKDHNAMTLKPADFAYLSDLGVYPNNRLIVCRRFRQPVVNDLTYYSVPSNNPNTEQGTPRFEPLSTLVSWVDEKTFQGDFFKFEFGENWDSDSSDLFDIFKKVNKGTGLQNLTGVNSLASGIMGAGTGLPEGFQLALLVKMAQSMGFTDVTYDNIPIGNPNLIRSAMSRTIKEKTGGGGLSAKIAIPFNIKYEQKFINGVDPTLVFLDIIANVLRFGTSNSDFILTGGAGGKVQEYFEKIKNGEWGGAIAVIIKAIASAMRNVTTELFNGLKDVLGNAASAAVSAVTGSGGSANAKKANDKILEAASTISSTIISKYRVQIDAAINSLTGQHSTPWHVTIGNPRKPFFASGDMYTTNVKVKFGNVLAFNDLPSTIEVSFDLTNARELGAQELFERFNVGGGRSYESLVDVYESNIDLSAAADAVVSESQSSDDTKTQDKSINSGSSKEDNKNKES